MSSCGKGGRGQEGCRMLSVLWHGAVAGAVGRQSHVCRLGQNGRQTRGAVGSQTVAHDAGQLDSTAVSVEGKGRRDAAAGRLVDGARHGGMHEWRVAVGRRGARRHGGGPLPAVAAVAKLVVVQAACELRLF